MVWTFYSSSIAPRILGLSATERHRFALFAYRASIFLSVSPSEQAAIIKDATFHDLYCLWAAFDFIELMYEEWFMSTSMLEQRVKNQIWWRGLEHSFLHALEDKAGVVSPYEPVGQFAFWDECQKALEDSEPDQAYILVCPSGIY